VQKSGWGSAVACVHAYMYTFTHTYRVIMVIS